MKTIFDVYVEMDSQATCDRMKQLCVDNKLMYFDTTKSFILGDLNHFGEYRGVFGLWSLTNKTKATETEFIELLKQYKDV